VTREFELLFDAGTVSEMAVTYEDESTNLRIK